MRQYCKVSSETHSQVSSEAFQRRDSSEANHKLFDKANGLTSLEVRATSLGANTTCDEVSQETRKTSAAAQGQHNDRDQSRRHTPLEVEQIQFAGGLQ